MNDRFSSRLTQRKVRSRRTAAWLIVVTALTGGVVYLVAFSPLLVVEDVAVNGADPDIAKLASQRAQTPMGHPLARVDTTTVADQIMVDTRIKTVDVDRRWPSTLAIELTMRSPEAVLEQPGRSPALVDETGLAYETVSSRPADVLRITAPRGKVDQDSLEGALRARSALEKYWSRQATPLNVTAEGDLRFSIGSIEVLWGQPEQVKSKAATLGALLNQAEIDPRADAPLTIDVTAPETPIVSGLPAINGQ